MRFAWAPKFRSFTVRLLREILADDLLNAAAALAYFLTLAIFPSLLFLLAILPFLPIEHLDTAIWDLFRQALPQEVAELLRGTLLEVTQNKKGGLLSFSIVATIWASTSGTRSVMEQLNKTDGVIETRSFVRTRLVAMALTFVLGALVILAMVLVVAGGIAQSWLIQAIGYESMWLPVFAATRWLIIVVALFVAFIVAYYWAPDRRTTFRSLLPGCSLGCGAFILASLGLRFYVGRVANYHASYGSIGAVIALMLWLWVMGIIFLVGAKVNTMLRTKKRRG